MMSFPTTRPGNPERGWNDPPMFNFTPGVQMSTPRRTLNKRVAFPASVPSQPGHAVLNPGTGPPVLNPVLSGSLLGQPNAKPPTIQIGLKDTPLGNPAPPTTPIQILPPSMDASAPQAVPLLVPCLVPIAPQVSREPITQAGIQDERLEDLLSRLSLSDDEKLLQYNLEMLNAEIDKYKAILTLKICDDVKRKFELIEDRWKKGNFSEVVKVRLTQLSEALSREETDKANQLHLALMVDHISEVNQWMMGVKRLIQQQQLASKERELFKDKSDDTNDVQQADESQKGDNCDKSEDEALNADEPSKTNEDNIVGSENTEEFKDFNAKELPTESNDTTHTEAAVDT